jgi:hypothetical protein
MELSSNGHDIMTDIMSADIRLISVVEYQDMHDTTLIYICLLSPWGKRWKRLACHPMASLKRLPDIHWRLLDILLTSFCHVVTIFTIPPPLFSTFPIFPSLSPWHSLPWSNPSPPRSRHSPFVPPPLSHDRHSFKLGWDIPKPKSLCQTKKISKDALLGMSYEMLVTLIQTAGLGVWLIQIVWYEYYNKTWESSAFCWFCC